MPPIGRSMKNKWAFKIKCNSLYWVCFMVCRYIQVPGVDISENYSPVADDVTFCILLLMVLYFGYSGTIVDVETAFLYKDLEEEIYMECPKGMLNVKKVDCIIFKQVHLPPCPSSEAILQKGCQDPKEFRFCQRQY